MSKIPLLIEPETDELMVSYLWRLAIHNGFNHVSDLLHGYILPNNDLRKYQRQRIRADANNIFPAFYNAVDIPIDHVKFYLAHTIYGGLVPLTTEGWHMQMISHAFHSEENIESITGAPVNMLDEYRICPLCQKEDFAEKGFWYYHTFHHMPGVSVCAKHNIPLQVLKRSSRKIVGSAMLFDENNQFEPKTENSPEWAYRYATFARSLLEKQLDTNVLIIHQAILKTLREKDWYDTENLLNAIHTAECNTLTDKKAISAVKERMHGGNNISLVHTLSFMTLCYQSVSELQAAIETIPFQNDDIDKFISVANGQYDVMGEFYRPLLEMIKKDNGEHFLTTLKGFIYGWRENSADASKSAEAKFEELFQNATDGSYRLLSPFTGSVQPVLIKHDICGKEYQIVAREFLINNRRCNCERSYTLAEARKIVERHKGFKLIDYPIGKYKPCKILHEYCGNVFEIPLANFITTPKCRRCETIKDHSEENIEQLVRDLVGDEYTVIDTEGKAKGKITIRHNICGKEHTYWSRMFTEGSRCPYCNNFARDENFRRYVAEVSDNKYRIGKQLNKRTTRYEIINTETNEVKILTRNLIMQELTRPTPSSILPLDKRHISNALKTHQDIIWEYLTEHYSPDDYICYHEIPTFKDIPEASMSVEIGLLCTRKKKLFRIHKGHNSIFAFKDKKLSPNEITEILYIKRNGVRYGCIHSKTLAYELGILPEKPKSTYIMTNVYIGMHGSHLTSKGVDLRLTSAPILITEDNYKTLQFIDLCWAAKHYSWNNAHNKIAEFAKGNNISMDKVDEYLSYYKESMQIFVRHMIEEICL